MHYKTRLPKHRYNRCNVMLTIRYLITLRKRYGNNLLSCMATRELWTKLVQVNDWINDTVKRTAGIELMPNSIAMCCFSVLCRSLRVL